MGYTLTIGQLKTTIEGEGLDTYVHHTVESVTLDEAPAFNEPTDYTNSRWPSYGAWHDAMRFVGLHEMMFNEDDGLLASHPGCVYLTKEHKAVIDKAHKDFYEKYPNCKAGFPPKISEENKIYEDMEWPTENNHAVRLEWLKFWVDWALLNCTQPVFKNS